MSDLDDRIRAITTRIQDRALVRQRREELTRLRRVKTEGAASMGLMEEVDLFIRERITRAIASHPYNYEAAALSLGISRRVLNYQMSRLGITRQQIVGSSIAGVPVTHYPQGAVSVHDVHRPNVIPVSSGGRSGRRIAVQVNVSVED